MGLFTLSPHTREARSGLGVQGIRLIPVNAVITPSFSVTLFSSWKRTAAEERTRVRVFVMPDMGQF